MIINIRTSHVFTALALGVAASGAQAVNIGISPTAGPVVNPWTSQATQVWKLVGRSSGCTAFQISPEWVMSSNHCEAGATSGYTNESIAPGVTDALRFNETRNGVRTCEKVATSVDLFVCRLNDPSKFISPIAYPPLVAGPYGVSLPASTQTAEMRRTGAKYGSLMLYGRAGPDKLAFLGFHGAPYGFSPITDPTGATIPVLVGGDSGGALFWFSPTTGQPAFTGIVTEPLQFMTEADIGWIRNKIAAYGDTPPATVAMAAHYGGPAGDPAPELSAKPFGVQATGGTFTLGWSTPATGTVTRYDVSFGSHGAITGTASVAAGGVNQATFAVTLGSGSATACVQPVNAVAPANPAWVLKHYPASPYEAPGCQTFDLRWPGSVAAPAMSVQAGASFYTVTATWVAPSASVVPVRGYRLNTSIGYATGPKRNATRDVGTTSAGTPVPAGSTVCVSVAAISQAGVVGPFSASSCKKAQ